MLEKDSKNGHAKDGLKNSVLKEGYKNAITYCGIDSQMWFARTGHKKDATLNDGPIKSKLNDGSKTLLRVEPKKVILERMRCKVIFEDKFPPVGGNAWMFIVWIEEAVAH